MEEEIPIFGNVGADHEIPAVPVLGNLHRDAFWCEPGVALSTTFHNFTCLQGTSLFVVFGLGAGWERWKRGGKGIA